MREEISDVGHLELKVKPTKRLGRVGMDGARDLISGNFFGWVDGLPSGMCLSAGCREKKMA